MSQILVVVPPPWVSADMDYFAVNVSYGIAEFIACQGGHVSDLNERLLAAGYYPDGDERRIVDVLVLDDKVFLRIE